MIEPSHQFGHWKDKSYGIVAMKKCLIKQYDLKWDEYDSYGLADSNFYIKCQSIIKQLEMNLLPSNKTCFHIIRHNVNGFYHQWHPDNLEFKNMYYLHNNLKSKKVLINTNISTDTKIKTYYEQIISKIFSLIIGDFYLTGKLESGITHILNIYHEESQCIYSANEIQKYINSSKKNIEYACIISSFSTKFINDIQILNFLYELKIVEFEYKNRFIDFIVETYSGCLKNRMKIYGKKDVKSDTKGKDFKYWFT